MFTLQQKVDTFLIDIAFGFKLRAGDAANLLI